MRTYLGTCHYGVYRMDKIDSPIFITPDSVTSRRQGRGSQPALGDE